MSRERDSILRLTTSNQVVNADFFNEVCHASPFVASMMFEKFKEFLDDDYFTDIERQALLLKFFEGQDNLELVREVLNCCNNSRLKKDYLRIIFEWTYRVSDDLLENTLSKYDSIDFLYTKEKFANINKDAEGVEDSDFLEMLLEENKKVLFSEDE